MHRLLGHTHCSLLLDEHVQSLGLGLLFLWEGQYSIYGIPLKLIKVSVIPVLPESAVRLLSLVEQACGQF